MLIFKRIQENKFPTLVSRNKSKIGWGFTVIEILVVLSLISLVLVIIFITIKNSLLQARDTKRISEIKEIAKALEIYWSLNNEQYPKETKIEDNSIACERDGEKDWCEDSDLIVLLPNQFSQLPKDPLNNNNYYYYFEPFGSEGENNFDICYSEGGQCPYWKICATLETTHQQYCVYNGNVSTPITSTPTEPPPPPVVTYTLTVSKSGSGSGTVTSNPSGINCGSTCSYSYSAGTTVTLTASPSSGSTFAGWSGGGCSGTGTCTVTMNSNITVTATFEILYTLTVSLSGDGNGTIMSHESSISCPGRCSASFPSGTTITLVNFTRCSNFNGWSGCDSIRPDPSEPEYIYCDVTMNSNKSVTGTFVAGTCTLTVFKEGCGKGTVTSNDGKINCGSSCNSASAVYTSPTFVSLTATADPASMFRYWSKCDYYRPGGVCDISVYRNIATTTVRFDFTGCYTINTPNIDDGQRPSITIGRDGNPVISYYDATNGDLRFCKCLTSDCSSRSCRAIDTNGDVGFYSSIAIGTDGNPVIAYYDYTNKTLKFCKCLNSDCSSVSCRTLGTNLGSSPSIAIGRDGNPVISCGSTEGLKVCKCSNSDCSSTTCSLVDSTGGVFTSIAIGNDGNPVIAHQFNAYMNLRFCKCLNPSCTSANCRTIYSSGNCGWGSSLAIGVDGKPVIIHWVINLGALYLHKCYDYDCTSYSIIPVYQLNKYSINDFKNSIAIGTDGNPIVAFYEPERYKTITVCKCLDSDCTSANCYPVGVDTGIDPSIAIGNDGNPVIAYSNYSKKDLTICKCTNSSCTNPCQ